LVVNVSDAVTQQQDYGKGEQQFILRALLFGWPSLGAPDIPGGLTRA
jgi:hypothetical protein